MCDLVQEHAEEYANKERIKRSVELFNNGTLSVEAAARKREITEEKFFEYVERYRECS